MDLYQLFLKPYESYTTWQVILEAVAAVFGLLSVHFSVKKNIWVYPTGLVSTVIYVFLLYRFGLLGDMLINFYYTVMSIYGWILWAKNSSDQVHIEVNRTSRVEWRTAAGLFALSVAFVAIVYYFKPAIDQGFRIDGVSLGWAHLDWANWLDVITTAIFLVGMWLMARRKIENWLFWIVGDFICVPMMMYKGLAITSIQYFVFTIMAIIGYRQWLRTAYAG